MNNQNLYKNSDFTKTGLTRFFNFVFLKKIDEKDKKEAEELFDGGINANFVDMWIFGGWGVIAVVCFFVLSQKYITTNLDTRLWLDLLISGIFGLAWSHAAQGHTKEEIEASRIMETNLTSKKIALFVVSSVLGIYFFGFKYANIFFGAIFATFVFFETLLRFIRKDYLNFRKLADGTLLFLSPQNLVPKKFIFIAISSIALCIGTYGASIYLIGEWKVKKAEEQKIFQEEQKFKIRELERQAEANGSAFIVDSYTKVKPLEHEKAVWEALKIDGGWNLNTTVYYPWSPDYPGHGGKTTRYIR